MWEDKIVNDIRRIREEHASKFEYNLDDIFKDLKEKESKTQNKKVSFKPKKYLKPTGTV
ncbi:MAG: hypothetical protein JW956_10320 [Calditrichaceae bacterium]|nr:hypothetical protein [Calditrichaceae bacterium]